MAPAPIEVFNPARDRVELERVYGERWLRWTYETTAGRLLLWAVVKRAFFSRWYGWRMSRPASAARVRPFLEAYDVDPAEFAEPVGSFASFNDFFSRRLRPPARPIDPGDETVVFPADGRHLGFPTLGAESAVYAKGQRFDLGRLLADEALARRFDGGSLVISRLCPVDYHRFHFPCRGTAGAPRAIAGDLFSVSPIALRRSLNFLLANKRALTVVRDTPCGLVVVLEIGATCVGTIVHSVGEGRVAKGDEKGFFRFGGSCVITLFEPGRVRLAADLVAQTAAGRETYARMGEVMGDVVRR